jgi:hypothetical protein
MKLRSFNITVGGRGGTSDIVYFSGFNVERIVAACSKRDAGTTGQLYAVNYILPYFDPFARAAHDDVPKAYYGWFPPDGGTVAHESVTGNAMTIAGAGSGINLGVAPGQTRYQGVWGSLNSANSATLTGSPVYLIISEANAQSWTWLGWVFYTGTANANIYVEANAAVTLFITLTLTTAGAVVINKAGVGGAGYASANGLLTANQWFHLALVFNATTNQMQVFINGASVAGPTAYSRSTGGALDRAILNQSQNSVAAVAGVELYQNVAMNADDITRHIDYVNAPLQTGGFIGGTATLARLSVATVIFSNDITPGFDSASYTLRVPLTAVMGLQTLGGVFLTTIDTWEREIY